MVKTLVLWWRETQPTQGQPSVWTYKWDSEGLDLRPRNVSIQLLIQSPCQTGLPCLKVTLSCPAVCVRLAAAAANVSHLHVLHTRERETVPETPTLPSRRRGLASLMTVQCWLPPCYVTPARRSHVVLFFGPNMAPYERTVFGAFLNPRQIR